MHNLFASGKYIYSVEYVLQRSFACQQGNRHDTQAYYLFMFYLFSLKTYFYFFKHVPDADHQPVDVSQ